MKFVSTLDLPLKATMAHVAAAIGIFPSVGQARKNGFDRPIELGHHVLTKKKVHVTVVDRPLTDEEKGVDLSYRPDLEPGFWPNYVEPNPLAKAIERPLADPNWQEAVLSGYVLYSSQLRKNKEGVQ